ncbi:MAG: hypothetical protein IID50_08135 [Proteobacteria bacterium]|nr:hypothetical protein [Pseudomonadota bacterium]
MSTAPALVREVQAAGGQIAFADGRLKLSAPAPLPDGLVSDLRAHKAEILSFLQGQASSRWGAETAALVAWFLGTPPPPKPFSLYRGVTVLRPDRFWESLKGDIAGGPGKARACTGAFQKDLRRLAELFGGPATVGER